MQSRTRDKRTLLVETALDLFYRQGIHAVGINEVLKASGVAKKTLYNHFASKEALIAATVEHRDQRFQAWLLQRLAGVMAGRATIEAVFIAVDDWINERDPALGPFRGCFFINTSAEYSDDGCEIFQCCQRHKLSIRALLYKHALVALGDDEAAERLADSLVMLKEGAIVAGHLMGDKQSAVKARATARRLMGL